MRRLILLRPEPGVSASLERARALGLDAISLPLFGVHPLAWAPPDAAGFDAVLATSANAIRHGGSGLDRFRLLPMHAVGEATAEAAREAGFTHILAGSGDVGALLDGLSPDLRLFHPCGRDHRDLSGAPQRIMSLPVYAAEALPAPKDFADIDGAVVAVHSPRSGARFADLIDAAGIARAHVRIAAISEAAAAVVGTGWDLVLSATAPNDRALLELAALLCEKPSP